MWYTAGWVLWIVLFAALETAALVDRRRGDTLSEHTWDWFCLRGGKAGRSRWCVLRRFGFLAFWAWLTIHFLSGGAWL